MFYFFDGDHCRSDTAESKDALQIDPSPAHPVQLFRLDIMSETKKLRVGWHREHFLSPLLQLCDTDEGSNIELVEQPGGSGEMMVSLKEGRIDVCIGG